MDEPMRYAASAAWQTWWQAAAEACGVASRPLPHDASSAARHYQAWPRYAAAVGPRFESLSHVPALRAAATAAFEPFQLWWAPPTFGGPQAQRRSGRSLGLPGVQGYLIDLHHGRSTVHDVVTRIERELGREAKPFDLSVDILAVTYPPVLVQGEHHAVVSGELVADETSYRDWLYDSIRPMA